MIFFIGKFQKVLCILSLLWTNLKCGVFQILQLTNKKWNLQYSRYWLFCKMKKNWKSRGLQIQNFSKGKWRSRVPQISNMEWTLWPRRDTNPYFVKGSAKVFFKNSTLIGPWKVSWFTMKSCIFLKKANQLCCV